mgnify:CR=1 FL=1
MIDVTTRLCAIQRNPASGITWIKLLGDDDFEWIISQYPDTPADYIAIGGVNNGSFRMIKKATIDSMIGE